MTAHRRLLVDSHCHLDFPAFAGHVPDVLARARAAGIGRMVTISTHVGRFETYRALAEAHEEVFFSVGTHPHQAAEEPDIAPEEIVRLSGHSRCVAIGEAGLDYHYERSPREVQKRVFRAHIAAARETGLPLVIHARDAAADPHTRLLVETDAPYLAPEPHRGRQNEPAYVAETARVLAGVLGLGEDDFARLTTANFYRLFAKA